MAVTQTTKLDLSYGTLSEYNAVTRKKTGTLYFATSGGGNKIYRGEELFSRVSTVRLTSEAYDTLRTQGEIDKSTFYLIVNGNDVLQSVYIGYTKFAEGEGGNSAFTYTFPFSF